MFDDQTRLAQQVFGDADLGDQRLERRLVEIAAQSFRAPAGTITTVFTDAADREAVYRFVENPRARSESVLAAQLRTTARLASREPYIFVPVDGSSLTVTDRNQARQVGTVGAYSKRGRGLIVVSALAVTREGTPIGLSGQRWWSRDPAAKSPKNELRHSTEVIDDVIELMREHAPSTKIWLQMDRLYDAQLILEHLDAKDVWFTVRASRSRRLFSSSMNQRKYSHDLLAKQNLLGLHSIEINDDGERRVARLEVRTARTTVWAKRKSKTRCPIDVTYVDVRERRRNGLHWTLITNRAVETFEQALEVVTGYTTRWRIEEFHRAWKNGACHVEDTQLRSREAIIKWATILAAVAVRATRLTYLAREKPELPASEEFSPAELTATVLLSDQPDLDIHSLTLANTVDLIARLGGYTGKSSGGPPGPTTLARGLRRVADTAKLLKTLAKNPKALRQM
jgi:Transposase DNA-binding/Transposase DDE domain